MDLNDYEDGEVAVIELGGRLLTCQEMMAFQDRIRAYLDRDCKRFLIDLEKVECMGSVGLGSLIAAYTTVKKAEGRFVLTNIGKVHNLLHITKLYGVFEAYDTRTEAMRAARL